MAKCVNCIHFSYRYRTCDATGIEEDVEYPEVEIRCDFYERR